MSGPVRSRSGWGALAALAVVLLTPWPLAAQNAGATLQGTVTDDQGGLLPGATVTVTNAETGYVRVMSTDTKGWFRAAALAPGRYNLRVELAGFGSQTRSGLTLTIGQEATLALPLKVAALAESIDVTAETPVIETTKSTLGTTVTRSQLDELPIVDRNFAALANLTPGITGVGGGGVNASGQLNRSDTQLIDGVSNDETVVSGQRGGITLEAVREYVVMPSQFSAEYGEASGAIMNVVTRSGTNKMEGRVFAFDRDDALDSTNPFAKAQGSGKAPFSQQRFGGVLGGPVVRDRLHYFAAYEGLRQRETSVITSPLVPVANREVPHDTNGHQILVRGDYQYTTNHTLVVKYRFDQTKEIAGNIGDLNTYERGYDRTFRNQDVTASETWILSPRAVNEVRFQYSRLYRQFDTDGYSAADAPAIVRPSANLGKAANQPQGDRERYIQLFDNFSYTRGTHNLKAGASLFTVSVRTYFLANKDGTFTFATDAPFNPSDLSTYPTLYTRTLGDPISMAPHDVYTAFLQDSWLVRRNLTLNYGLRYAVETTWSKAPGVHVPDDKNDFAPRVGFAWDPFKDGRTSVRGGFGLYYDQTFTDVTQHVTLEAHSVGVTIRNPGYPDPYGQGTVTPQKQSTSVAAPHIDTPYTRTFSLGVARELVKGLALSVDAVSARGFNLFDAPDINYPDPVTHVRPNPDFLRITQYETAGHSWSDALLVGLERHSGRGPRFGIAYTYSKALRDVEDFTFVAQDQNRRAAEKGLASNDRRHQIVANLTWALPLGFQVGAVVQARSGRPYNITTGTDNNGDTVQNDRPDLLVPGGSYTDRATFSSAFTGRVGNLARNAGTGPGFFQLDARLSKRIPVGQKRLETFVEAFNATNHVNPGNPVGNLRSSAFGQSTGLAGNPRQVELGFRFDF
jgi:hypothetical protein